MISAEDGEELDEAVEHFATDTTWSWVKWFINHLHVWKKNKSMKYVEKKVHPDELSQLI